MSDSDSKGSCKNVYCIQYDGLSGSGCKLYSIWDLAIGSCATYDSGDLIAPYDEQQVHKEEELTEAQVVIAKECDSVKDILLEKNRKYGNSALEPLRVFSQASAEEQINVRLDDKLSRLMSGQLDDTEDVELDLIGYLMLKRVKRVIKDSSYGDT